MRTFFLAVVLLTTVVWPAGCSSSVDAPVCIAGRVENCPCPGGALGRQTCLASGTYGECVCDAVDAAPDRDGGSGGGTDAGPDAPDLDGGTSPQADGGTPPEQDAAVVHHGHVVLLGWSGIEAHEQLDREIANAMLLPEGRSAIEVLEYTEFATFDSGWDTQTRVRALVSSAATLRGRTVSYRELTHSGDLAAMLPAASVLLIYGQPRSFVSGLRNIGVDWHDTLSSFVDAGGVIVILTSRDLREEWQLVAGTGFFQSGSDVAYGRAPTEVVLPEDPVVSGVTSPYAAPSVDGIHCFPGMTGGVVVARTTDETGTTLPTLCATLRHIVR